MVLQMATSMPIQAWAQIALIGGFFGAAGQAIRVIVGLKKLNDQSEATGTTVKDNIVPSALVMSLIIGFMAGLLAALLMSETLAGAHGVEPIFGLLGAGYSGADFIEGFMSRYLPDRSPPDASTAPNPSAPNLLSPGAQAAKAVVAQRAAQLPPHP